MSYLPEWMLWVSRERTGVSSWGRCHSSSSTLLWVGGGSLGTILLGPVGVVCVVCGACMVCVCGVGVVCVVCGSLDMYQKAAKS